MVALFAFSGANFPQMPHRPAREDKLKWVS